MRNVRGDDEKDLLGTSICMFAFIIVLIYEEIFYNESLS